MREFKPGEVALIRVSFRDHVAVRDSSDAWLIGDSNSRRVVYDDMPTSPRVSDVRALAVIDPEDREQVERLWNAWRDGAPDHRLAQDNLQSALREFADPKPPKPEEPTGLGAVVEDTEGAWWVRTRTEPHEWRRSTEAATPLLYRSYADITAVRVLSPGVEASESHG